MPPPFMSPKAMLQLQVALRSKVATFKDRNKKKLPTDRLAADIEDMKARLASARPAAPRTTTRSPATAQDESDDNPTRKRQRTSKTSKPDSSSYLSSRATEPIASLLPTPTSIPDTFQKVISDVLLAAELLPATLTDIDKRTLFLIISTFFPDPIDNAYYDQVLSEGMRLGTKRDPLARFWAMRLRQAPRLIVNNASETPTPMNRIAYTEARLPTNMGTRSNLASDPPNNISAMRVYGQSPSAHYMTEVVSAMSPIGILAASASGSEAITSKQAIDSMQESYDKRMHVFSPTSLNDERAEIPDSQGSQSESEWVNTIHGGTALFDCSVSKPTFMQGTEVLRSQPYPTAQEMVPNVYGIPLQTVLNHQLALQSNRPWITQSEIGTEMATDLRCLLNRVANPALHAQLQIIAIMFHDKVSSHQNMCMVIPNVTVQLSWSCLNHDPNRRLATLPLREFILMCTMDYGNESLVESVFTAELKTSPPMCGNAGCICPLHIYPRRLHTDIDRGVCRSDMLADPEYKCKHYPSCIASVGKMGTEVARTIELQICDDGVLRGDTTIFSIVLDCAVEILDAGDFTSSDPNWVPRSSEYSPQRTALMDREDSFYNLDMDSEDEEGLSPPEELDDVEAANTDDPVMFGRKATAMDMFLADAKQRSNVMTKPREVDDWPFECAFDTTRFTSIIDYWDHLVEIHLLGRPSTRNAVGHMHMGKCGGCGELIAAAKKPAKVHLGQCLREGRMPKTSK